MRNHVYREHRPFRSRREAAYEKVSMQTWGRLCGFFYWTVVDPNSASTYTEEARSTEMERSDFSSTWEERMIQLESRHIETQRDDAVELHPRNKKDDVTPWLLFTMWPDLFEGKDIKLIAETRYVDTGNPDILKFSRIDKSQLNVVNRAFDRVVSWGLESLAGTDWNLRCWLRSPRRSEPSDNPFKLPQNESTLKRYTGLWKYFLCYCFRTALLDEESRELVYGIRFNAEQLQLIWEIEGSSSEERKLIVEMTLQHVGSRELANETDDDDFEEESVDTSDDDDGMWVQPQAVRSEGDICLSIDPLAEKLFQLCVSFLTQG